MARRAYMSYTIHHLPAMPMSKLSQDCVNLRRTLSTFTRSSCSNSQKPPGSNGTTIATTLLLILEKT
jgi:hypothetical protein